MSGFTSRSQARAAGFKWLAPILTHNPAAQGNINDIRLNKATYENEGWVVCGWGTYGQSASPEQDARDAVALVQSLGLAGWIANGEAWAEGANRSYSQLFINEWNKAHLTAALAVSCLSSDTANFARDFDYQAWLTIGSVIMPQVYGNEHATLTVDACLGMMTTASVPQRCLNLTFGTYAVGNPPTWNTVPYYDYERWPGPRSVYTGDGTDPTAWPKLKRPVPSPPNGGGMQKIGSQDGIKASIDRLRKIDPSGTNPNRNPNDLSTWGAWDKLERTLQILRNDHDSQVK